jgi:phthiocerol/phenolphthiocerol synthesis type-I polyketide synthase E
MGTEVHDLKLDMRTVSLSESSVAPVISIEDDTTRQLSCIWQELLAVESVGVDQNYFDLGGDSALAVRLFAQIEKIFGIKLPLATIFDAPTIEELARVLRSQAPAARWSPLVPIQPAGSRPPFFCIHGPGGNVLIYRDLSRQLGGEQPFYGLQSQGIDGQQPLLTRIEEMAALYVEEIQQVQPRGPYFLGGYSVGGIVAFEVAQQLIAKGEQVAMLALLDTIDRSKIDVDSNWARFSYQSQRLWFRLMNFLLLGVKEKREFLVEKWNVLRSRTTIWPRLLLGKRRTKDHPAKSESVLMAQIRKKNDRAAAQYVPSPLRGFIVDIRPLKQYSMFERPDVKLDRLGLKGHEVIILPVYPPDMLGDPFVKDLAVALERSMEGATRRLEAH